MKKIVMSIILIRQTFFEFFDILILVLMNNVEDKISLIILKNHHNYDNDF